jgi:predicted phosphodiesterase
MLSKIMQFRVHSRYLPFTRVVIIAAVCLVAYNEYFCYIVSMWQWPQLHFTESTKQEAENELRLLFVADPQLVGLRDEPPLLGYITRWDSDRFLRLGFWHALGYVLPDVVVFLGDLLDEGSSGSDEEFVTYVNRFNAVFRTPSHLQKIYIAGDNDVGGEGFDRKELWKINRFRQYFNKSIDDDITTVGFVDFFKVSLDFNEVIPQSKEQQWSEARKRSAAQFRIILNHMTLLSHSSYGKITKILEPHVIVTAHTHLARFFKCHDCRSAADVDDLKKPLPPFHGQVRDLTHDGSVSFDLNDLSQLHELAVPTCSYRMGVPNMGFGAAAISKDGKMFFSILWLPSRYRQLASYVVFLGTVLLTLLIRMCSIAVKHIAR